MKAAFYKGKNGNIFDWLIMLWTWGEHSHVELVFSDGVSFSSSQWDGGVRFKNIKYNNPDRWTMVDIEMSEEGEKEIRQRAEKLVGKGYDWLGILFDQFLPLNIQDPDKWWCSESLANILRIKPERVSPNKLYNLLCKL